MTETIKVGDDVGQGTRTFDMRFFKPYEPQAIKNHGQDLKMLASRGGLEYGEAVIILLGLSYREGQKQGVFKDAKKTVTDLYEKWSKNEERIRIDALEMFVKQINSDYDCDSDAHKYGHECRCCAAKQLIENPETSTYTEIVRKESKDGV